MKHNSIMSQSYNLIKNQNLKTISCFVLLQNCFFFNFYYIGILYLFAYNRPRSLMKYIIHSRLCCIFLFEPDWQIKPWTGGFVKVLHLSESFLETGRDQTHNLIWLVTVFYEVTDVKLVNDWIALHCKCLYFNALREKH